MKKTLHWMLLAFAGLIACSGHRIAKAQTLSIAHPDDPSKKIEYFLEKPEGGGHEPTRPLRPYGSLTRKNRRVRDFKKNEHLESSS